MSSDKLIAIMLCCFTLVFSSSMVSMAADDFDPKTEKTIIQLMRENPDSIPLEPRDPSRKVEDLFRDLALHNLQALVKPLVCLATRKEKACKH